MKVCGIVYPAKTSCNFKFETPTPRTSSMNAEAFDPLCELTILSVAEKKEVVGQLAGASTFDPRVITNREL